jgi:hypothetical protein
MFQITYRIQRKKLHNFFWYHFYDVHNVNILILCKLCIYLTNDYARENFNANNSQQNSRSNFE